MKGSKCLCCFSLLPLTAGTAAAAVDGSRDGVNRVRIGVCVLEMMR